MFEKNLAGQKVYFILLDLEGALLAEAEVTGYHAADGVQSPLSGTVSEMGGGQYCYELTQEETNAASAGLLFISAGAIPVGMTVSFGIPIILPELQEVGFGVQYGLPGALVMGLADLQPAPVAGEVESATAAVVARLGMAGGAVVGLVAREDIRVDRLPAGYDGTRPAIVATRSGGGPAMDLDGDEAVVMLRVYGDGTRAGCEAVVAAVVAQCHRVYGWTAPGLSGHGVSFLVGSRSDTVDPDFEGEGVPVCVVTVETTVTKAITN